LLKYLCRKIPEKEDINLSLQKACQFTASIHLLPKKRLYKSKQPIVKLRACNREPCLPRKKVSNPARTVSDKIGGKSAILQIHDISRGIKWRAGLKGLAFP
jgi:hypothetical protein